MKKQMIERGGFKFLYCSFKVSECSPPLKTLETTVSKQTNKRRKLQKWGKNSTSTQNQLLGGLEMDDVTEILSD